MKRILFRSFISLNFRPQFLIIWMFNGNSELVRGPTQKFQKSRVVAIQAFWRKDGQKARIDMSTGILLNSQILLTAAHNIYLDQLNSIASDIRVIFIEQADQKIDQKNVSMLVKLELNRNVILQLEPKKSYTYDLAIIRLQWVKPIALLPIFLGIEQQMEKHQKQILAQVCGYPDFKIEENQRLLGLNLAKDPKTITEFRVEKGVFDKVKYNYIYYKQVQTFCGQSGGPILMNKNGSYCLVGIHTEYNKKTRTGKGLVLNSYIWKLLVGWASQLKINLNQYCIELPCKTPLIAPIKNTIQKHQSSQHAQIEKLSKSLSELKKQIAKIEDQINQLNHKYQEKKPQKHSTTKNQYIQLIKTINQTMSTTFISFQKFHQSLAIKKQKEQPQRIINEAQNQSQSKEHDQSIRNRQQLQKDDENSSQNIESNSSLDQFVSYYQKQFLKYQVQQYYHTINPYKGQSSSSMDANH